MVKNVVVQSPSRVQLFVTPWTAEGQASLSLTICWSLCKFMSIALVIPSSQLVLWCSLILLPSVFPSIRDFSSESAVPIRWQRYWSLSFSISPFHEYSGLTSFRIDWFDLLAVQRTLTSLLQYCNSKASVLRLSAFFLVQHSHLHMSNGNTISSVQFSCSVMSDSLQPHELQHARPPCPSPTPRAYSNPCPLSQWCHPTNSSSVIPFSSCTQSLPASGSSPMSQLFAWDGQSIGVSASASVLPMKTQDWNTITLTTWTFAGKVMSLLFNTLSRFVIAFLPRSKCLLIAWL